MNFGTYAEEWLALKQIEVCHSQYVSYRCCLKHLQPIYPIEIGEVTVKDIQAIITALAVCNPTTKKPTAKKTLRDVKMTAKQVFEYAIESRIVTYNPAVPVKIPKNAPKETRRALTDDEIGRIVSTPHQMQTAGMIMLFSGLRRGEVIPLLWDDIDLVNGTIRVCKAVELIHNRPILKEPKTEAGNRIVQMPSVLISYLKNIEPKDGLVISEKLLTEQMWKKRWASYVKALDMEGVTAHMFRHTACTMMIEAGMDVSSVRLQMGHSDIQTTLAIYTHVTQKHRTNEVKKLDSYLKNSNKSTTRKNSPLFPHSPMI